jgi:hypothetical protein
VKARSILGLGLAVMLAACAAEQEMMKADLGPLAGYPGIQQQIINYYDNNAVEGDWNCTEVDMEAITRAQTVREDASTLVVAVHYDFQPDASSGERGGGCRGFHTRLFTFSKVGGGLTLESMSGEQRQS